MNKSTEKLNNWKDKINFCKKLFLILLIFGVLFISLRYGLELLNYKEWGDESETVVTSKVLASGKSLYSEVFNHHGPLTFLPGYILEIFGSFKIEGHRATILILIYLSALSIYFSPVFKHSDQVVKCLATTLYLTLVLSYLPAIFGHMYKYQVLAGLFLVTSLSLYVIPAILGVKLAHKNIAIGIFLIFCLPFFAISYFPAALLLFLSTINFLNLKIQVRWVFISLIFNILFLALIGSLKGFIAYHIYLNIFILPEYIGSPSIKDFILSAFKVVNASLSDYLIFIVLIISIFRISRNEKRLPWRSLMVLFAIGSFLIRGGGFHSLPYVYASLFMSVFLLSDIQKDMPHRNSLFFGVMLLSIVKLSLLNPVGSTAVLSEKISYDTDFSRYVKALTKEGDEIIAYSFNNFEYIASERLPAAGHFFYLPWQDKYNENPILGISINACKQIKENEPVIMQINKWRVWGRYPWEDYAGCIQEFLDRNYTQIPGKPYYVLKEKVNDLTQGYSSDLRYESFTNKPSTPLERKKEIEIKGVGSESGYDQIGIYFGTYQRVNHGYASLILTNSKGDKVVRTFDLSKLNDNSYEYFYFKKDIYTKAYIEYSTGGGVSVWESFGVDGKELSCINYFLNEQLVKVTPGCPVL